MGDSYDESGAMTVLKSQYLALQSDFQDFAQSSGIIKKQLNASLMAIRQELDDSKAANAEAISNLEKELQEKDKHIQLEKSLRLKEEQEKLDVTKKFEKAEATILSVQKDCENKQGELGKLQTNFDEYVNFLEKELAEKNELTQQEISVRKKAEQERDEMKEAIKKVESSLMSVQKDCDEKHTELTKLQNSFDEYVKCSREVTEKVDAEINETKKQLVDSLAANEASTTALETLNRKVSALEKELDEKNEEIGLETSSRLKTEQEREEIEKKCDKITADNAALINSTSRKLSSFEEELKEKYAIIEAETSLRRKLEQEQIELKERCEKAVALSRTVQNDYDAKQAELTKVQENFENHIASSRAATEKANTEISETKRKMEEAASKSAIMATQLDSIGQELIEKNEQIQREASLRLEMEQHQAGIKEQCGKSEAALLSLQNDYNAKGVTIEKLQSQLDASINSSREIQAKADTELAETKKELLDSLAANEALKTGLSELEQELEESRRQTQAENSLRLKSEQEQTDLKERFNKAEISLLSRQEECDRKQLELTKLQTNFDQYVKSSQDGVGDLDASLTVLKQQLDEATAENAILTTKLESISPKLQIAERNLQEKHEQVQHESSLRLKAEQEQADMKEKVKKTETSLSSLQKDLDAKTAEFGSLQSKFDEHLQFSRESTEKADADLAEMNQKFEEAETKNVILKRKLDDFSPQYLSLEKELDEKKQQLQVENALRLKAEQGQAEIKEQCIKSEESLLSVQKDCEDKQLELTILQTKLDESSGTAQVNSDELQQTKKTLEEIKAENCDLIKKLDNVTPKLSRLEIELNEKNQEIQQEVTLRQKVEEEVQKKNEMIQQETSLRLKAEQEQIRIKEQLEHSEAALSSVPKGVDAKQEDSAKAPTNVDANGDSSGITIEKVITELAETNKKLQEATVENESLGKKMNNVHSKLSSLEKELEEKNHEINQEIVLRLKAEEERDAISVKNSTQESAKRECNKEENRVSSGTLKQLAEALVNLEQELEDKNQRLEQEISLREQLEIKYKKTQSSSVEERYLANSSATNSTALVCSPEQMASFEEAVADTNEKLAHERSLVKCMDGTQLNKDEPFAVIKKMKEDMNVLKNLLLFRERELNETRVELAIRNACLDETRIEMQQLAQDKKKKQEQKQEQKPESTVEEGGTASIRSYTVNSSDNSSMFDFNDNHWPSSNKKSRESKENPFEDHEAKRKMRRSKSFSEVPNKFSDSIACSSELDFEEENWTSFGGQPTDGDFDEEEQPYIYVKSPKVEPEEDEVILLQKQVNNLQKKYQLNESHGKKLESQVRQMKKQVSQSHKKKIQLRKQMPNPFLPSESTRNERPVETITTTDKKKKEKFDTTQNPFLAAVASNDDNENDDDPPPVKIVITKDIRTQMAEKLQRKERKGTLRREFTTKSQRNKKRTGVPKD